MHPIERVRFCCPTVFRLYISFVLLREIFVKFRRRSNIVCSIFYPLGRGLAGLTMRRNRTRVRIKWRFRRTTGNWGWFRNCDIVRTHSHNALRRNSYFLSLSLFCADPDYLRNAAKLGDAVRDDEDARRQIHVINIQFPFTRLLLVLIKENCIVFHLARAQTKYYTAGDILPTPGLVVPASCARVSPTLPPPGRRL